MTSPFYDPYEPVKKPPEFDPTDPTIEETVSPFETAAVLRMQRAGWSAPRIMQALGISMVTLKDLIKLAMDDENEAHRVGRPIHDPQVPRSTE